jgi:uncharacterized membrane protein
MTLFRACSILATVLCSLVVGFLFAFGTVVMPGIKKLEDGTFIQTFQVIDGVIQKGQPVFGFVWVGSVLSLVAAAVMGMWKLGGLDRPLMIAAALVYLLGVQVPTITINIPLNNQLQRLDVSTLNEAARKRAREDFETRWNRWNVFRAVCASVVSVLLVLLLSRL